MSLLEEAEQLINNDRANSYGDANTLLPIVAHLWESVFGTKISPLQVIQAMVALKLARTIVNPGHRDSWVDLAGYAGLSERVLIKGAGDGEGSKLPNSGSKGTGET